MIKSNAKQQNLYHTTLLAIEIEILNKSNAKQQNLCHTALLAIGIEILP